VTYKTLIKAISDLSAYGNWTRKARCFINAYFDQKSSYDYIKDMQSCSPIIKNMLLCYDPNGLGSYWIGKMLGKSEKVNILLDTNNKRYEIVALLDIMRTGQ